MPPRIDPGRHHFDYTNTTRHTREQNTPHVTPRKSSTADAIFDDLLRQPNNILRSISSGLRAIDANVTKTFDAFDALQRTRAEVKNQRDSLHASLAAHLRRCREPVEAGPYQFNYGYDDRLYRPTRDPIVKLTRVASRIVVGGSLLGMPVVGMVTATLPLLMASVVAVRPRVAKYFGAYAGPQAFVPPPMQQPPYSNYMFPPSPAFGHGVPPFAQAEGTGSAVPPTSPSHYAQPSSQDEQRTDSAGSSGIDSLKTENEEETLNGKATDHEKVQLNAAAAALGISLGDHWSKVLSLENPPIGHEDFMKELNKAKAAGGHHLSKFAKDLENENERVQAIGQAAKLELEKEHREHESSPAIMTLVNDALKQLRTECEDRTDLVREALEVERVKTEAKAKAKAEAQGKPQAPDVRVFTEDEKRTLEKMGIRTDNPTPREILGLRPEATQKEIATAIKKLKVLYHTDHNKNEFALNAFKLITEVEQTLQEEQRRAEAKAKAKAEEQKAARRSNA